MNRYQIHYVVFLCCICASEQVPASSTERIWEELSNVKTMMAAVSDELHRFNSLYLSKLEYRMVTMASILSSLDSNVKNLQERAHVWDTFQLHVAAWNEQIKTLDKKVDILSRGQDKMMLVDGKISSLMNLDYKIERIFDKLEGAESKLLLLEKNMDNQNTGPLFNEFATRGALSTLKVLERKVDRLHGAILQSSSSNGKTVSNKPGRRKDDINKFHSENLLGGEEAVADKGRLIIRCNTPVVVEELLRDVASKVDVIFDKISRDEDMISVKMGDMQTANSEITEESSVHPAEMRLLDKLWKRITSPHKKTARALDVLQESVLSVKNITSAILDEQSRNLADMMGFCQSTGDELRSFTSNSELILKRTEGAVTKVMIEENEKLQVIEGYFKKQMQGLDERVSRICASTTQPRKHYEKETYLDVETGSGDYESPFPEVKENNHVENEGKIRTSSSHSCEDLVLNEPDAVSGIYNLGSADEWNVKDRNFFRRYCDISTSGGGWTVIQRRGDFKGQRQNFTLSWEDYKHGFGDLNREFWFGNEYIHRLTFARPVVLRIELESFNGSTAWAEYLHFSVDSEENGYRLNVKDYRGNASDSLTEHNSKAFSTLDRNNDEAPPCCPCVPAYGGGWWFYSCFEANLNGVYYPEEEENKRDQFRGIIWEHWLGDVSLKRTEMKIRDREFSTRIRHESDFEDMIPVIPDDVHPLDIPEDP